MNITNLKNRAGLVSALAALLAVPVLGAVGRSTRETPSGCSAQTGVCATVYQAVGDPNDYTDLHDYDCSAQPWIPGSGGAGYYKCCPLSGDTSGNNKRNVQCPSQPASATRIPAGLPL